ncbi:MAG: universal stress protein [Thermomicrobiales bacterium]|nr:universal stress protein [Thermomicrobiales bacterium]
MSKTIVAPLDGSRLAERALPYAALLAQRLTARVHLVRATQAAVHEARVTVLHEARAYLERTASELAAQGVEVTSEAVYGDAATHLAQVARQQSALMLIMATHGRSGFSHAALGSVAEAVLRHAPAPVWLIGPRVPAPPLIINEPAPRIVVPLDGSSFAEEALVVAAELGTVFGAELILVGAVLPAEPDPTGATGDVAAYLATELAEREDSARAYLRRVACACPVEIPRLRLEVRVGEPAAVIQAVCEDTGATFVVMATHGRTGLLRLVLGSVATAVLRTSTVPVLAVRPGVRRPSAEG